MLRLEPDTEPRRNAVTTSAECPGGRGRCWRCGLRRPGGAGAPVVVPEPGPALAGPKLGLIPLPSRRSFCVAAQSQVLQLSHAFCPEGPQPGGPGASHSPQWVRFCGKEGTPPQSESDQGRTQGWGYSLVNRTWEGKVPERRPRTLSLGRPGLGTTPSSSATAVTRWWSFSSGHVGTGSSPRTPCPLTPAFVPHQPRHGLGEPGCVVLSFACRTLGAQKAQGGENLS